MMCVRQFRIGFELADEPVVLDRLADSHPRKERYEKEHGHDRDIVRRRRDGPKLMPVPNVDRQKTNQQNGDNQHRPFIKQSSPFSSLRSSASSVLKPHLNAERAETRRVILLSLAPVFISYSSRTGACPEIPPSFLMRQKCTAMKIEATSGIPIQCQMYERKSAFESTIEPPSSQNRTSL